MTAATSQRGASTIAVALLLSFAALLSVAFANRSVLLDAKTSANQYRAAQAREAAEAGLAWALAQMNHSTPIGDDCRPSGNTSDLPFREHSVAALRASCEARDSDWSCRCGAPIETSEDTSHSFSIQLAETDTPGVLQLNARGTASNARSQLQVRLGRLPGLDSLPAAALTVRGAANFGSGAFGVHHTDPASGGLTVHSGAALPTLPLYLRSTPGTPASASVLASDSALAALTAQGLFASLFRMDKTHWRTQPMVREIECSNACDSPLAEASSRHQLMWLRGGLRLDTPVTLGTPQRPVLLVVDGPVELNGNAVIHGLVYASQSSWTDTAGAAIHGAVVFEDALQASGSTQVHHHLAVLQALHQRTGSYARVANSWRDF
jgi:Tfp pilus assembly protein PilX